MPAACSASSDRLKPFTSYQFRVKATNDIGDSDYSQDSEAITTLQDGERRARRNDRNELSCRELGCGADALPISDSGEKLLRKSFSLPGCCFF